MSKFGALELVSIIYASSKLEIMPRFFCWISYSLRNYLKKFESFYQQDRLFWNQLNRFNRFQLKFIIGESSNSKHLSLFWSYLPHLKLESCSFFFSFFWIPYFSRKILSNFEKFSQSARPIGIWFNWFIESACMEHLL